MARRFFLLLRAPPMSSLFPYTTLFRSVFDTPESDFTEIVPMIPPHWARIVGMDIGWDHPTACVWGAWEDRKSTRLNSSHLGISYAVFCLKKKKERKAETCVARSADV